MRNRAHSAVRRTIRVGLLARRPRLETLEERQLLTTFLVKNAKDAGADSLRDAITKSNAAGGVNVIDFMITSGGTQTIALISPLPTLDVPVTIDGYALNSGLPNTSPDGTNAKLSIQILGVNLPAAQGFGLVINAPGVVIDGLNMSGFKAAAISDTPLGGNAQIAGNFLGTNETGANQIAGGNTIAIALQTGGNTIGGNVLGTRNLISGNVTGISLTNPNGLSNSNLIAGNLIGSAATGLTPIQNTDGIVLDTGTTGNTIGGLSAAARNLISAEVTGVRIQGDATTGNLLVGNYIGLDASGNAALANLTGVLISAPGNTIGGGSQTARNVISGNTKAGVLIDNSTSANASANVVVGNYVGLNVVGTAAIPNSVGVEIARSSGNSIGGPAATLGNVISGNSGSGVSIGGVASTGNVVAGNLIGTNPTGASAIPNATFGVDITDGSSNTIGGTLSAARNILSGNGFYGVYIEGVFGVATNNVVAGNFIGLDATGTKALGNVNVGVLINSLATHNTIGGNVAGAGNVVSGNGSDGISVSSTDTGTVIAGNFVGTDLTGTKTVGNVSVGIFASGASGTTIGGTTAAARNVVSGNSAGIQVFGTGPGAGLVIEGNYVGTDVSGNIALGNGPGIAARGLQLFMTGNNTVGGTTPQAANVFSGNSGFGVEILGTGATQNLLIGNKIGTNALGTAALPNSVGGVFVDGITNSIGGGVANAGNVISGNGGDGVLLAASQTAGSGNVVQGNLIGLNAAGTAALANAGVGVDLSGAVGSTIGGTTVATRNVISGNTADGVALTGATGSGNLVSGNYIGVSALGTVAVANGGNGVTVSAPNNTIGGTSAISRNVISGNNGDGVMINVQGSNTLVSGNYIGVGSDGQTKLRNNRDGVGIDGTSATIGGLTATAGNVISGNNGDGVMIGLTPGGNGSNAFIATNIIGLGANGTTTVGNNQGGVNVFGPSGTTIGGSTKASGNVISGNNGVGVEFAFGTGGLVQNNLIGTDSSGTVAAGNIFWGVSIDSASGITIGGTAGTGNVIAFNGTVLGTFGGVGVRTGTNDPIIYNDIYQNIGLGIDLGENGVTLNDHLDPDTGPNNLQNYPHLVQALAGPASTTITATLDSTPNTTFTIQYFASDAANADPSGFGEGQTFLGQSQPVTTDANGSVSFTTVVLVPATAGQVLSAVAIDPAGNSSEFAQDITVSNAATDLALTITAAPEPVHVGQNLVYTIIVTNNAPNANPASNVTVTDSLPPTVTYVSSASGQGTTSFSAGVVTANLGTLAPGATTTVTITVTPTTPTAPGAPLPNTASVSSTEGDTNLANNSATANSTVIPAADLSLTVTANPSTPPGVLLGQVLTYTIVVSNAGPSPATNIVVSDTLPASFTIVSATSAQAVVIQNGQLVTGTIASLAANTTATITIVVKPTTAGQFGNTVSITSGTDDLNLGNNGPVTVTTTVLPSADLGITIAASPTPGLVGQNYTYTVTVTNNGQSDATNVTVLDTLPSSVIFQSDSSIPAAALSRNGQVVKAVFAKLSAGQTGQVTIIVTPTVSGMITDTATVAADQGDPNIANNTATLTTTISPTADLGVTVTASPNPVSVGGLLQYVVTVVNTGPNSASGVIATDTLPANVTVVSVAPSQGTFVVNGSIVTLKFGSLVPNGVPVTATITVRPLAAAAAASPIQDNVSVTANEADPNLGNNTASVQTTVNASADLAISLTGTPDPVLVGTNLTYTIIVTNNGPSTATGVTVDDVLPANVTVISVMTDGTFTQGKGVIIANPLPIASGGTSTITIVVRPTTLTMPQIIDTASVSSAVADPVSTNNTATITTQVTPSSDLALTVTDSPDPLLIGGNLTYTITVVNNGPSDASNVTVTDTLPAKAVFVDSMHTPDISVGVSADGATFTASLGSLANGASKTFTLIIRPTTTGLIENTATVTSVQADPIPGNNTVLTDTTITPSADISVAASAQPSTVLLRQSVTFSFNVVNQGPSVSAGVVLTAVIPTGVSISAVLSNQGTITTAGQTIILSLPTLASGSLATLDVTGTTTVVGSLVATGSVTSAVQDPVSSDDSTFATANVIAAADLAITETASANPAPLHGNLTYTVVVTNNGPSDATNVVLTDVLPAGAQFLSATTSDGNSFTPVAGVLTVPLGTLLNGQSTVLTIVVSPTLMGTLNNTASVGATEADTVAANSTNVQLVTVSGIPGVVAFSAAGYVVDEKAGFVTISIIRVNGSDGPASVHVATSGGSAVAGVNYVATSTDVFFDDRQTGATFLIPILDDGRNNGDTVVGLVLSNPTGGIALTSPSSALLTIREADVSGSTNPNEAPLQVVSLKRFGIHQQPTQLVVAFNGPVLASTAQDPANYVVVFPDTGEVIPVSSAVYNATTSTVTLLMSHQLDVHKTYQITIRGTGTGAISTPTGNLLDGNNDNKPGGDYVATINASTLAFPVPTFKSKLNVTHKVATHSHVAAKAVTGWANHLKARMGGR